MVEVFEVLRRGIILCGFEVVLQPGGDVDQLGRVSCSVSVCGWGGEGFLLGPFLRVGDQVVFGITLWIVERSANAFNDQYVGVVAKVRRVADISFDLPFFDVEGVEERCPRLSQL